MKAIAPWLAAIVFAALVPAAILFISSGYQLWALPFYFTVALGCSLLLALMFHRRRRPDLPVTIGTGCAIYTALLILLLIIVFQPVPSGWWHYETGIGIGIGGLLGASSGLAFWLALRVLWVPDIGGTARPSRLAPWLGGAAALATAAVWTAPEFTPQRDCHDLSGGPRFQGLGYTITAMRLETELALGPDDLPKLMIVLESFAASHDMSLRYLGSKDDTQAVNRFVSLCKKNGPTIVGVKSDGMVKFFTYDLHGDIHWRAPMRELIDELEKSWPGKLRSRRPFDGAYVANPLKP